MQVRADIIDFFDRIAIIAESVQRKVVYLLVIGVLATGYLAFELVSATSPLWWNMLKVTLVAVPALIWIFVWSVLGALTEAPGTIAKLADEQTGLIPELNSISVNKPGTLRGVFSAVRVFRKEDGFGVLFDAVGGIATIANPFFAVSALLALPLLLMLIAASTVLFIF